MSDSGMVLNVVSACGPICIDPDDGAILCRRLQEGLAVGKPVTLDFTGVTILTSSFLNSAIGCLYASFDAEELADRLKWTGLDETDESLMRLVQANAVRFFSLSSEDRERLATSEHEIAESH